MVEAKNESKGENIKPVTPSRWEKYRPKIDSELLFRTAYKILDITPILIAAGVLGVSSYLITLNTGLPTPIRIGLGAAVGLGLYCLMRRLPWPEDN